MNRQLILLLSASGKSQNPPWQISQHSTFFTVFLKLQTEGMPPPALTLSVLQTAYTEKFCLEI